MSRIYGTGLLKSMAIAFRNFFRPNITLQYPHEKQVLPERSRWAVAMKLDEEGQHKCTGCLACEKACPDYIIKIETTTGEDRSKHIDHWKYEVGACMMCGLCVEACPYDAICMSHEYELARTDPDTLCYELLTDVPAASPKRKTAEPGAAPKPAAPKPAETPTGKPAAEQPETALPDIEKPAAGQPAAEPTAAQGSAPTESGLATDAEPAEAPDPPVPGEAPLPVDPAPSEPGSEAPAAPEGGE